MNFNAFIPIALVFLLPAYIKEIFEPVRKQFLKGVHIVKGDSMNEYHQINGIVAVCFAIDAFCSVLILSHVVDMDSVDPGTNIFECGIR